MLWMPRSAFFMAFLLKFFIFLLTNKLRLKYASITLDNNGCTFVCMYATLLFTHRTCKAIDLSDKLTLLIAFAFAAVFMHHRQLMRMLHFMRPTTTTYHAFWYIHVSSMFCMRNCRQFCLSAHHYLALIMQIWICWFVRWHFIVIPWQVRW